MSPEFHDWATEHHVSRETLTQLATYAQLVEKWQESINLVAKSTLPDIWNRHILDSAQLFPLIDSPSAKTLLDMGTGAGFPALVLAILGVGHVHMIESDSRKCAFLETVSRETGIESRVTIHAKRIANVTPFAVDVITARALAPLTELLRLAIPFMTDSTVLLMAKGQSWQDELDFAKSHWAMDCTPIPSITNPASRILQIQTLRLNVQKKGRKNA